MNTTCDCLSCSLDWPVGLNTLLMAALVRFRKPLQEQIFTYKEQSFAYSKSHSASCWFLSRMGTSRTFALNVQSSVSLPRSNLQYKLINYFTYFNYPFSFYTINLYSNIYLFFLEFLGKTLGSKFFRDASF